MCLCSWVHTATPHTAEVRYWQITGKRYQYFQLLQQALAQRKIKFIKLLAPKKQHAYRASDLQRV